MTAGRRSAHTVDMSARNGIRRYVLVPQSDAAEPGGPGVRRYRLAHLGGSPRGALGEDRHERLERAAGLIGTPMATNGGGPNGATPVVEEERGEDPEPGEFAPDPAAPDVAPAARAH